MLQTDTGNVWNTEDQEAERLNLSPRTLARRRNTRQGPPWFKIGGRILYSPKITDAYMMEHRHDPVAEASE